MRTTGWTRCPSQPRSKTFESIQFRLDALQVFACTWLPLTRHSSVPPAVNLFWIAELTAGLLRGHRLRNADAEVIVLQRDPRRRVTGSGIDAGSRSAAHRLVFSIRSPQRRRPYLEGERSVFERHVADMGTVAMARGESPGGFRGCTGPLSPLAIGPRTTPHPIRRAPYRFSRLTSAVTPVAERLALTRRRASCDHRPPTTSGTVFLFRRDLPFRIACALVRPYFQRKLDEMVQRFLNVRPPL